jgi:hypothetical protein
MRLNLKMREEGEKIRLIWHWREGLEKVLVNKKLFTLQEYKKLGGYFLPKTPGNFTYHIEPAEDDLCEFEENKINFIIATEIFFSRGAGRPSVFECLSQQLIRLHDLGTDFELTFFAQNKIPRDVICYEKIESGVLYFFDEEIQPHTPLTRIIYSEEKIRVFVADEKKELYTLKEQPHGTFQTKKNRA